MGEALAEARSRIAAGERPIAAVAVVDEAMVARAHDRVERVERPDRPRRRRRPARGRPQARPRPPRRRHDLHDPRALRDVRRGAARERRRGARLRDAERRATAPPARSSSSPSTRRCRAGSRSSAASAATRPRRSSRRDRASPDGPRRDVAGRPALDLWYPLPRRGVRVVDGAALEKRCAKAPRVRIPPSPPALIAHGPAGVCRSALVSSGRGRLVDYGAALEMRFGATRRGFESRPLRHLRRRPDGRWRVGRSGRSLTHLRVRSLRVLAAACACARCRPGGAPAGLACRDRRGLGTSRYASVAIRPSGPAHDASGYPVRAVLGGELAVPCTCNPLQQG